MQLWLHATWRLADLCEAKGDLVAATMHLRPLCEALSEQFFPPAQPPALQQSAFLRWNSLQRRQEELSDPSFKAVRTCAGHTLLRRGRLLLANCAMVEPLNKVGVFVPQVVVATATAPSGTSWQCRWL